MMSRAGQDRERSALATIVALVALCFVLLGIFWYGVYGDVWQRLWQDLVDRPGGQMSFRFILQPLMATIAAAHDGWRDAQLGRSPYFWTVLSHPEKRAGHLREGMVSTARIMLLGIAMDVIYQIMVLKTLYPAEAVLIASPWPSFLMHCCADLSPALGAGGWTGLRKDHHHDRPITSYDFRRSFR